MKTTQNPLANVAPHQYRSLFALICLIWLGLLCASCQPVLLEENSRPSEAGRPEQEPLQERFRNAGPPPVPEISWSEPSPCLNNEQTQAPNQQTVCARLFYRADAELHELIWSDAGIVRETSTLSDVRRGITSFSPDLTRIVIQTPRGHTAGGPLYLYDIETEQLSNLNEDIGLPIYSNVSALRVAGWHQNSQQLLLVNSDDEVVIWLDLASGNYRPLALNIDTGQLSPPRQFVLAPDGSGFTFVSQARNSTGPDSNNSDSNNLDSNNRVPQVLTLHWYDLKTDQTRVLLTVTADQGRLAATAISPNGKQIAYLLLRGDRRLGRSEELHLLDLTTEGSSAASTLLLSGHLGPTFPVWSPNGDEIAFIRRNLSEPRRAAPDKPPPFGDIWTISTRNGEATQLTFAEALDSRPVWSPDGRYLAFVTADGQIGMVATEAPGRIWQLDAPSLRAQFIQIAFAPQEKTK